MLGDGTSGVATGVRNCICGDPNVAAVLCRPEVAETAHARALADLCWKLVGGPEGSTQKIRLGYHRRGTSGSTRKRKCSVSTYRLRIAGSLCAFMGRHLKSFLVKKLWPLFCEAADAHPFDAAEAFACWTKLVKVFVSQRPSLTYPPCPTWRPKEIIKLLTSPLLSAMRAHAARAPTSHVVLLLRDVWCEIARSRGDAAEQLLKSAGCPLLLPFVPWLLDEAAECGAAEISPVLRSLQQLLENDGGSDAAPHPASVIAESISSVLTCLAHVEHPDSVEREDTAGSVGGASESVFGSKLQFTMSSLEVDEDDYTTLPGNHPERVIPLWTAIVKAVLSAEDQRLRVAAVHKLVDFVLGQWRSCSRSKPWALSDKVSPEDVSTVMRLYMLRQLVQDLSGADWSFQEGSDEMLVNHVFRVASFLVRSGGQREVTEASETLSEVVAHVVPLETFTAGGIDEARWVLANADATAETKAAAAASRRRDAEGAATGVHFMLREAARDAAAAFSGQDTAEQSARAALLVYSTVCSRLLHRIQEQRSVRGPLLGSGKSLVESDSAIAAVLWFPCIVLTASVQAAASSTGESRIEDEAAAEFATNVLRCWSGVVKAASDGGKDGRVLQIALEGICRIKVVEWLRAGLGDPKALPQPAVVRALTLLTALMRSALPSVSFVDRRQTTAGVKRRRDGDGTGATGGSAKKSRTDLASTIALSRGSMSGHRSALKRSTLVRGLADASDSEAQKYAPVVAVLRVMLENARHRLAETWAAATLDGDRAQADVAYGVFEVTLHVLGLMSPGNPRTQTACALVSEHLCDDVCRWIAQPTAQGLARSVFRDSSSTGPQRVYFRLPSRLQNGVVALFAAVSDALQARGREAFDQELLDEFWPLVAVGLTAGVERIARRTLSLWQETWATSAAPFTYASALRDALVSVRRRATVKAPGLEEGDSSSGAGGAGGGDGEPRKGRSAADGGSTEEVLELDSSLDASGDMRSQSQAPVALPPPPRLPGGRRSFLNKK